MLFGIDVSSFQGPHIQFDKVAAAGNKFVIHKVSEGDTILDPTRTIDFAGTKAAGMYTGIYHYMHPSGGDGKAQAQKLFDACGDTMPDLPPIVDVESADGRDADAVIAVLRDFIAGCKTVFGRAPMLYTGGWFVRALGVAMASASDIASECPLWTSEYSRGSSYTPAPADHPSLYKPWSDWTIWQFSGSATVAGVPDPCDRDCFNGDENAFRALCGFPAAP